MAKVLLIVEAEDDTKAPTVEVAHEALFDAWQHLSVWIKHAQKDIRVIQEMKQAALIWKNNHRSDAYRWPHERLQEVYHALSRQGINIKTELTRTEIAFLEPEQKRLLRELKILPKDDTSHERRRDIGDRLAVIGDTRPGVGLKDGLPDIVWLPVTVEEEPVIIKTDEIEIGPVRIQPFFIAKYQVTYIQYQAFLDAEDGFKDERWWEKVPDKYKKQPPENQRTKISNVPRDTISWYQCIAFSRWINYRLQGLEIAHPQGVLKVRDNAEIRLPLEWEWQWAAQGGKQEKEYPWGTWQTGYTNTSEAGLNRTTAVGMYLHGAADCNALDMSGNLFEWCQSDRDNPLTNIDNFKNENRKITRGGSFGYDYSLASTVYRVANAPHYDDDHYSLRLALSFPIGTLLT